MLKLSGEVLVGKQDYGIDPDKVISIADDITKVYKNGKEICIIELPSYQLATTPPP